MGDDAIFADPDTHTLRKEWERAKAVEKREVDLCEPMWKEELDARLWERKQLILRKVAAMLEAKKDEE